MSIQSNKLMNLGDAKILYDDLRTRIEAGALKSALGSVDDALVDKYVTFVPEWPNSAVTIEPDKAGVIRRIRISLMANQELGNNGLEYAVPIGAYGNLMNPANRTVGKSISSTGEIISKTGYALYGPLVLDAGTYTVSGYKGVNNNSSYYTYTAIYQGEQTAETASSSNLSAYQSKSGNNLYTFTLAARSTVFIGRKSGSGYVYDAKVFSGELTDQDINKKPYGNQADISPWSGNTVTVRNIDPINDDEISTTEIAIPDSPAIYAGEIIVGVSRTRIISRNVMLDLANAAGLVMDSAGVFHLDLGYEIPAGGEVFSNLYRIVDYEDFAGSDFCIALSAQTGNNDETYTRIHIKDSRKTTLAALQAYTELQICCPAESTAEIAVDTTPLTVRKGVENMIITPTSLHMTAVDHPAELEGAIAVGSTVLTEANLLALLALLE